MLRRQPAKRGGVNRPKEEARRRHMLGASHVEAFWSAFHACARAGASSLTDIAQLDVLPCAALAACAARDDENAESAVVSSEGALADERSSLVIRPCFDSGPTPPSAEPLFAWSMGARRDAPGCKRARSADAGIGRPDGSVRPRCTLLPPAGAAKLSSAIRTRPLGKLKSEFSSPRDSPSSGLDMLCIASALRLRDASACLSTDVHALPLRLR